jgi:hypothetical protein
VNEEAAQAGIASLADAHPSLLSTGCSHFQFGKIRGVALID